jgi:hypothetical protein
VLKLSPPGKDERTLVVYEDTVGRGGRVKATITEHD